MPGSASVSRPPAANATTPRRRSTASELVSGPLPLRRTASHPRDLRVLVAAWATIAASPRPTAPAGATTMLTTTATTAAHPTRATPDGRTARAYRPHLDDPIR